MVMALFRCMCDPDPQYSAAIALGGKVHMLRVWYQAKQVAHSRPTCDGIAHPN
jgi:hypothetical protein